ncbi:MAG: UxaA family hydrolase [Comamonadaceae bacterium]|jgi:altronate dehydratase large subunit|nr:UxaA family hydrolase [Comamonadaceae bacterium]
MVQLQWQGYHRADGSVGVRNDLLVLSIAGLTGPTARRVAAALPGSKCVTMPFGGGLIGEDAQAHLRSLIGFGLNPNVGAVLLIGSDTPKLQQISQAIAASKKPFAALCLDDCEHDALTLTDRAIRAGAQLRLEISRLRRQSAALSDLCVGLECGRSDPSSGMVANPLIGQVADRLEQAGAQVIFGETLEWLGAEHLLAQRASSTQVAQKLVAAVERREQLARSKGQDLLGNNPGPTNIAAGLSTIEEKSLGAIAKSGSAPIRGILALAQRPSGPGLYAMDASAYSPESLSGFVSAGAQMLLFSTGVGNSYVSLLAPTLKISANPRAARTLMQQLDFDASAVFEGRMSASNAADQLMHRLVDVASGTLTWGEVLGEGDEVVARLGEAL